MPREHAGLPASSDSQCCCVPDSEQAPDSNRTVSGTRTKWLLIVSIVLAGWLLEAAPVLEAADAPSATAIQAAPASPQAVVQADPSVEPGAGDWAEFLGPLQTGVSPAPVTLSEQWPAEGLKTVWSARIGEGYSAPSVRADRMVVYHRIRSEELTECRHPATGEVLWQQRSPTDFEDPYGYSGGPRCTPLLTEDRCYTYSPLGLLQCRDLATGALVWERDTAADWKVPEHFFGFGCTPVLHEGKLIVLVGGQPNSAVVAFDAATGKTLWEAGGKSTWDGAATGWRGREATYRWTGSEMLVSYSTPLVATIHGKVHLLCLLRQGLVSLDPATGQEHLHFWFRPRVHESVNAARPVVMGHRILLCAAYEAGSALIEVAEDGRSVREVWRQPTLACHWSTPIAVDKFLYGFSGRHKQQGALQCVDSTTGEVVWETSGWDKPLTGLMQDPASGEIRDEVTGKAVPYPFYGRGSKIQIGKHFVVLGEDGNLALVRVNSHQFEEVARMAVPGMRYPTWTAPIYAHNRLYLRGERQLICLDLPLQGN